MTRRRKILLALLLVATVLAGSFAWTFVRRPLPLPDVVARPLPSPPSATDIKVWVVPTGSVESQHGFAVRGASLLEPLTSSMVAILVEHPKGRILIDAGMGRDGVAHVATIPLPLRAFIDLKLTGGIADVLKAGGVKIEDLQGVLLTHAHWDHVSGLADLPGVPVLLPRTELTWAESTDPGAELFRQIDKASPLKLVTYEYDGGAYGPFEKSHDIFGDGTVVVVPMAGHTPGSIGVFVNLPSGARYLFIGDTAWAKEGVEWPAEKPWISRRDVDNDPAQVRVQLGLLHRLAEAHPELTVVPAHDARVHKTLPAFADRHSDH